MSEPSAAALGGRSRAAMLVIHGIGQQSRYGTLDRVVRGLRTVFGWRVERMAHTTIVADGRVISGVRLEFVEPLPRSGATELDVFEAYWALLPSGLTTARGVWAWLTQMLLTPFRNWARIRLDNVALGRRIEIVVGEVLAALFFVAIATAQIAGTLLYVKEVGTPELFETVPGVWFIVESAAAATAIGFLIFGVRGALAPRLGDAREWVRELYVTRILREPATWADQDLVDRSVGAETRTIWARTAWACFVPLAVVVALIEVLVGPSQTERLEVLRDLGSDTEVWTGLLLVGAWTVTAKFLRSVAGDVAVYAAEDSDGSAGELRSHILESVVGQLRVLLEPGDYHTVHIVSHSLGTVIGYDALNRFRVEVEHQLASGTERGAATAANEFEDTGLLTPSSYERIGSFITLACPLDHISYFFGAQTTETEPVRTQILERRFGLRRRDRGADAGRFRLDQDFATGVQRGYYPVEPSRFVWINIKAVPDPIGTKLRAFEPDQTITLRYPQAFAHTKVLKDRRTYEAIVPFL